MSHTTARAWATPKSTGDQIQAAEVNAIDEGQFYAWNRFGDTTAAGNCQVLPGGHQINFDASDNASSEFAFYLGVKDLEFNIGGVGNVKIPAGDLQLTGTDYPILGSRTAYRSQASAAYDNVSPAFYYTRPSYVQHDEGGTVDFPLDAVIDGATLTAVRVRVTGTTTAGFVSLPTTLPTVKVYKVDGSTGVMTQIGSTATDASANVGDFNGAHNVEVTGLSEVIDQSGGKRLFVKITGASGNYVADEFQVISIRAAFTVTALTPG